MNGPLAPRGLCLARIALGLAASASPSRADFVQHSGSIPAAALPWQQTVTLPAFDPALGVLTDVNVFVGGLVHGDWGLENTGSQPTGIAAESLVAVLHVTLPAGSFLPLNPAEEGDPGVTLAPYDGTTDYAGPSGIMLHFANATGGGRPFDYLDVYEPGSMQAYVAAAPGQTIAITVDAADASGPAQPPLVEDHDLRASAAITVTYVYEPHPAAFCRSDPSSGCPCSNLGTWGCSNSSNVSGGRLEVLGQASIANDTLVLLGSGMTNGLALYLQGTSLGYGGRAYGDGRRCVGGALLRIGAKVNAGGASRYPEAGDPSVSLRGGIPGAGTTRYYQTSYRDARSFCTDATVNVTSGISVLWGP